MTKTIELSRIHLFNIITQYKAMFNDDELVIPGRDLTLNESAIFYHWLEEKVDLCNRRMYNVNGNVIELCFSFSR